MGFSIVYSYTEHLHIYVMSDKVLQEKFMKSLNVINALHLCRVIIKVVLYSYLISKKMNERVTDS